LIQSSNMPTHMTQKTKNNLLGIAVACVLPILGGGAKLYDNLAARVTRLEAMENQRTERDIWIKDKLTEISGTLRDLIQQKQSGAKP
jgi:hypothetical protein